MELFFDSPDFLLLAVRLVDLPASLLFRLVLLERATVDFVLLADLLF